MSRPLLPLLALLASGVTGWADVSVLTSNYDNSRTNSNLSETILTPQTVNATHFGKLFTRQLDGYVYAQPLYVSKLSFPQQGVHNVVYVATMHNSVYAFDADDPNASAPLWQVSFGNPVDASVFAPTDIIPEVGILSTPVIDPATNTLYCVSFENGGLGFLYRLHALDLITGAEKFNGPTVIQGSVQGSAPDAAAGVIPFIAFQHLQRPGLLLANGAVYIAFGSHADSGYYHGWIMSYDASNISTQLSTMCLTPAGLAGALWQAGRGLAATDSGDVYGAAANGDYDGAANFGQSVIHLPPLKDLTVSDWFTPGTWEDEDNQDEDLGAAGLILLPGTSQLIVGGKTGTLYLLDRNNLGHTQTGDMQALQHFSAVSFGIFNLAVWTRTSDTLVFVRGWGEQLKSFQYQKGAFNPSPYSTSSVAPPFSYDGMAVSANGGDPASGILWQTSADAAGQPVSGTLHAYSANDLTTELWNSNQNAPRDSLGAFAKFANPTVVNGKVYVSTFSKELVVYGALSVAKGLSAVVNAASYDKTGVSPGEIVTAFGAGFGPSALVDLQLNSDGNATTQLGQTELLFDGVPAPLVYATRGQVSAVVPYGVAQKQTTQVALRYQGHVVSTIEAQVKATSPGLFTVNASGAGQVAALNGDGSLNSITAPASAGSIIVLYGTGGGVFSSTVADGSLVNGPLPSLSAPVSLTINGQPAKILYSGPAPGEIAGMLQINAVVPNVTFGSSSAEVLLTIGSETSPSGTSISVQ